DLDFIHGGAILLAQTAHRPIHKNPGPNGTPNWGKEFKQKSIKYFNRSLSMYSYVAGLLNVNNYLDLDPTYKDERGNALIRMTYDYSDSDRKREKYIQDKSREVLKEIGADSLYKIDE